MRKSFLILLKRGGLGRVGFFFVGGSGSSGLAGGLVSRLVGGLANGLVGRLVDRLAGRLAGVVLPVGLRVREARLICRARICSRLALRLLA